MTKKDLEEILAKHAKNTDYKLEIIIDNLRTVKADVSDLKGDVSTLKGDVAMLKGDVAELKNRVEMIFEQVGSLSVDMATVKETLQLHKQRIGR